MYHPLRYGFCNWWSGLRFATYCLTVQWKQLSKHLQQYLCWQKVTGEWWTGRHTHMANAHAHSYGLRAHEILSKKKNRASLVLTIILLVLRTAQYHIRSQLLAPPPLVLCYVPVAHSLSKCGCVVAKESLSPPVCRCGSASAWSEWGLWWLLAAQRAVLWCKIGAGWYPRWLANYSQRPAGPGGPGQENVTNVTGRGRDAGRKRTPAWSWVSRGERAHVCLATATPSQISNKKRDISHLSIIILKKSLKLFTDVTW